MAAPLHPPPPESPDDESTLVARAQQRDARAFESLYRAHVGRVYAVCLRMVADVRRAEELTQKAFIRAWEKLPLFRHESAIGSWLHRLAVNVVLAELRADFRRTARIFAAPDLVALETPRAWPQPGARLDLEQAIAALPPQARAVFVLHDVEGYKHEEIAAALGIASGTSKAQLHRARSLLQEKLR